MAASKIKAAFQCDIKRAWNTVTSLYNYQWRSDLSRIEVLDDKRFVEYTKKGYSTTFTVTCEIPYERWEFDMENGNMKGHWIGLFKETAKTLCFGLKKRIRRIEYYGNEAKIWKHKYIFCAWKKWRVVD